MTHPTLRIHPARSNTETNTMKTAEDFAHQIWDEDDGLLVNGWDEVERVIDAAMGEARAEGYRNGRHHGHEAGKVEGIEAAAKVCDEYATENAESSVRDGEAIEFQRLALEWATCSTSLAVDIRALIEVKQ